MNLSESKTAGDNVAVIVLSVIATAAVVLRLWARSVQKLKLQADDYLVVIALVSQLFMFSLRFSCTLLTIKCRFLCIAPHR